MRARAVRALALGALASLLLSVDTAAAQPAASVTAGPFTVSAEALLWWFKKSPTPVPLIAEGGALDQPESRVLLGGDGLDTNPNPGLRLTAGYAPTDRWGVEASILYIPTRSTANGLASSGELGSTDLLLPYFDVLENREAVTELSFSPIYRGSIREELKNSLLGAEVNGTWAVSSARPWRVDALGGFRWLRLRETYTITTSSPFIPPQPVDVWDTTDKFDTFNNFYGVQLGVRGRYDMGPWFVNGTVKLGLGAMVQHVEISGSLVTNDFTNFGPTQTFAGGYFALPTNIGHYTRTVFGVVPEAALNVGYQITPRIAVFLGYTMLYANAVARPGNQIDRRINTTQSVSWVEDPSAALEGPARPAFKFKSSDFWAQGINLGLGFRF